MCTGFDIPWVGVQYTMGNRVKIPWVGYQNLMDRVKMPRIVGSIYHGYGDPYIVVRGGQNTMGR